MEIGGGANGLAREAGIVARSATETRFERGAALTDMRAGLQGLGEDAEGLRKACKEFESFLIYQMIREMRKTIDKNPMFHGGHAEDMFEGFVDMETAREISDEGGLGLWKILYDDMTERMPWLKEAAETAPATAARAYKPMGAAAKAGQPFETAS